MIIRAENGAEVRVAAVFGEKVRQGSSTYPALRFKFENGMSTEDLAILASGKFDILNDDGTIAGTHEGYNQINDISVTIAQITTAEQERDNLAAIVSAKEAEIKSMNTTIRNLEQERDRGLTRIETLETAHAETEEQVVELQKTVNQLTIEKADLEAQVIFMTANQAAAKAEQENGETEENTSPFGTSN